MTNVRIGHGFDVHAFGDGDHVMLGGVRIASSSGVVAHSDGDVVLHALCDAMLGALALGDIGQHFPPTDARWKDADSRTFRPGTRRHFAYSHFGCSRRVNCKKYLHNKISRAEVVDTRPVRGRPIE